MTLRTLLLTMSVLALNAAVAHADFFTGEPVDGPDSNIRSVGDVDIARDGTGAVAYVKRDGGVDHVFVSRLISGVWQTPERVDQGLAGAGAQPVVGASDNGRVAVAFISGGQLFATVRPAGAPGFASPQQIAGASSNPSIDMSMNGGAYISFTSVDDVRVARMDREAQTFALLPDVLDISQPNRAGTERGRSNVAVSADGTAVVVWGENGHVYGRRVFFDRVSTAPQDLNVAALEGHAGGPADSPSIDIEDDSSFAWAVFRQQFDGKGYHLVAKRLLGSLFEQETKVDAIPFGADDEVVDGFIDISGRGTGLASSSTATFGAQVALLHDNKFFPAVGLNGPNLVQSHAVGGVAETNDAYAFWLEGATAFGGVHAVSYDIDPAKRTVPDPSPRRLISGDQAVVPSAGLDAGVNRAGDAVVVYVAEAADGRRLMSAGFDRVPGAFRSYTTSNYRKFARPPLSWSPSFELWGPPTYTVEIDGKPFGSTSDTKLTPGLAVPDGEHSWRVVATDRRGQSASTPPRVLRVDATSPEATFKVTGSRRRGKPVRVLVRAADGSLRVPAGSGVKIVRIAFGDGAVAIGRLATHRYSRGGTYTVRVTVGDNAGNVTVVRRQIRIKKK